MTDRDRLIELIEQAEKQETIDFLTADLEEQIDMSGGKKIGCSLEYLAYYLLEKGVIVPPCKVGDTVYVHDTNIWTDECCHCEHFQIGGMGDPNECARTKSPFKHPDCIEISETIATKKNIYGWFAFGEFGKTVFLTKEEAEQALKERKNNG